MRNEYSANLELSTSAAYDEEGRKKGKPSREYRKAREQKRNHAQSGILAHNLAMMLFFALDVIELVKLVKVL